MVIKRPSVEKQGEGETVVAMCIEFSPRNLALEGRRSIKGAGKVLGGIIPRRPLTGFVGWKDRACGERV